MSSNEKLMMKDEELDRISGGTTWICEHTGIGTEYEKVKLVSVPTVDASHTVTSAVNYLNMREAKIFMKNHEGDIFQTADGKAFTL